MYEGQMLTLFCKEQTFKNIKINLYTLGGWKILLTSIVFLVEGYPSILEQELILKKIVKTLNSICNLKWFNRLYIAKIYTGVYNKILQTFPRKRVDWFVNKYLESCPY